MFYTGIGSRTTPEDICSFMTEIAKFLYAQRFILRSGHADGADIAFENGSGNLNEIWVPWPGFNGSYSRLIPCSLAFKVAEKFHPYWLNCSPAAKKLHARNVHQIAGVDLKTPSKFVVCWTSDGKDSGGTGLAIRIANALKIPVYNLHDPQCIDLFKKLLNNQLLVDKLYKKQYSINEINGV